jgi:hypothetical protein
MDLGRDSSSPLVSIGHDSNVLLVLAGNARTDGGALERPRVIVINNGGFRD